MPRNVRYLSLFSLGPLKLQLQGNPLECDEKLFWIKEAEHSGLITWVKNRGDPAVPECENFSNENWKDVTLSKMQLSGKSNKCVIFKAEMAVFQTTYRILTLIIGIKYAGFCAVFTLT